MSGPASGRRLAFAIPGDIGTPSGGYGYDRRMIAELRGLGWTVEHIQFPAGFPFPSGEDLAETARQLGALDEGSLVLVDGLAFGAMPQVAMPQAKRLRLVALVHHPLAMETGLTIETAGQLKMSETAALIATRGIVVTSPMTARTLAAEYEVGRDHPLVVALPGTEPSSPAHGSGTGLPTILAVGSLTPRKDHATLVGALARLADRDWKCRIVGSDTMDRQSAQALRNQIEEQGLARRIEVTGAVDDVAAEYDRADIFALASRYEGYGMVFAEAMARGLPIIACRGGAVPDLVPDGAGALVEPGDVEGFAAALALMLDDPARRQECASASLEAGRLLPDWPIAAATLSDFLETIR